MELTRMQNDCPYRQRSINHEIISGRVDAKNVGKLKEGQNIAKSSQHYDHCELH